MEKTYWGNNGTHQQFVDALNDLVPTEGKVENGRSKNKKLEKFRQASNAYYDIFNNGGCNRRELIYRIFNVAMTHYRSGYGRNTITHWNRIHEQVEPIMDKIILDAAVEQGLLPSEVRRGIQMANILESGNEA